MQSQIHSNNLAGRIFASFVLAQTNKQKSVPLNSSPFVLFMRTKHHAELV